MGIALPRIATILPPLEGFGVGRAGAVGMVVRGQAATPGFACTVFGGPQSPTFPGIDFRGVAPARWMPGNVNLRYGAALLRPLHRLRPALIEVHNRPELALMLALMPPPWGPRCPVVLFLHNDPQGMRQARSAHQRSRLLRRLGGVVTVSEHLRQRLLDGVTAAEPPVAVLPNAVSLAALPPPRPREKLVLFVGRVVHDKAPDAFVAACATALPRLPGWQAAVLGADRFSASSPETAFSRRVREEAAVAGVQMWGYRDHDAVLQAMAQAAIVVVPSRWQEPFGLVALEAMASGAALICSPRGGLPEVAGDAALYAEPEPGLLAAAITRLAEDPDERAALAAAGRARAGLFAAEPIGVRLAAIRRAVVDRELGLGMRPPEVA